MVESDKNNLWLNIHGEDRDISDIFAKKLSGIIIHFGVFENCLLLHLVSMRQEFPALKDSSNEIPGNFVQKLKLWRSYIHIIFENDELYKDNCDLLFKNAIAISRLRNSLVHGIWMVDPDGSDSSFNVLFLRNFESAEEIKYMKIDIDYVSRLQADCLFLANFMNEIIINQFIRSPLKNTLLNFRMKPEIDDLEILID